MDNKISLRQIISLLNKGGSLPEWCPLEDVVKALRALKSGRKNYTADSFISYAIVEQDTLVNILFIKSSKDATFLLRLLQNEGDDE